MKKGLLLQDQDGTKGMTSALVRGLEVSNASQWGSSFRVRIFSRGLWPGRKKEDGECPDRAVLKCSLNCSQATE